MNSTGKKASDIKSNFWTTIEDNDCNNVEPENVELREPVMQNEASTYSKPLLSRISRIVDEWETDVSVGNFDKPTEGMSPFATQTSVSSKLFTIRERSLRVSNQFTSTSSIIGDGFSSFHQRSLPKLKMSEIDGNPQEWSKKNGMFLSMIDSSPLTNDEKMGHLKGLVNDKAKRAIARLGYSGAMYQQARKFKESVRLVQIN